LLIISAADIYGDIYVVMMIILQCIVRWRF